MIQNSQQRSPGAEPQAVNLPQVAPSIPQPRHDVIGLGPDGMTTIINTPPSSAGSVHRKPPRGLSNGKPRNKAGNRCFFHSRVTRITRIVANLCESNTIREATHTGPRFLETSGPSFSKHLKSVTMVTCLSSKFHCRNTIISFKFISMNIC